MRKIFITLFICIILATIVTLRWRGSGIGKGKLDFPIEVINEFKCNTAMPTWCVLIFLSKDHFNAENLEKLFALYSAKYPNIEDALTIEVYTEKKNLLPSPAGPISDFPGKAILRKPGDAPTRAMPWDAIFKRRGSGAISGGGENEWYEYIPDLNRPDETKVVVLKGRASY